MVQPAESIMRKDATRSCGTDPAIRCSLPESEMSAVFVVIPDVFREQALQMASFTPIEVKGTLSLFSGQTDEGHISLGALRSPENEGNGWWYQY
jgi:hypothetical protein